VNKNNILVIIPTINEMKGLKQIIPKLSKLNVDILVVDDNSTDGSRPFIVDFKKKQSSHFNYIFRDSNRGFRSAYFCGFEFALENNYRTIIMMDGDGAHDPLKIAEFLSNVDNGYDLIVGSRYIAGGQIEYFPFWRKVSSWIFNWLAKKKMSTQICDWTSGFIVIKADILKKIIYKDYAEGFGFLFQMKKYAVDSGAKVKEIPINFANCKNNKSKFNARIAFEAFVTLLKINKK